MEKEKVRKIFEEYSENGGYIMNLIDKIDEIYKGSKEVKLWTNGVAFRRYQGQEKTSCKQGWRKVRAVIYEMENEIE